MSVKRMKKWLVKVSHSEKERIAEAERLAKELGLHTATAQLLINRGCSTISDASDFLAKRTEQFHDPFIMADMEKAASKILETVENKKKIVVYGDYDVDGVTSVSILCLYLKKIGADVDYYIPSRINEGYGMSEASISRIKSMNTALIVTVDTGITAVEEAKIIKSLDMTLIVTDHHECYGELPDAYAVVNPKRPDCSYPFKDLAGVGVVFKLLCAIEILRNKNAKAIDCIRSICLDYIDLVAIGTIADVMPLRDENRLIVSVGLMYIEKNPRMSLEQLIIASIGDAKSPKRKITSGYIGFTIAPRINAAGRIKDASIAVELFLSDDKVQASKLAEQLCNINSQRQQEENLIIEEAYDKIEKEHDFKHDPVIVLDHESWHHGIIGIVASRITERYGKPCIMISFDDAGDNKDSVESLGKGSGRSIKGMNLVDALNHCSDLLEKYGGHELAAGLSIKRENLDDFKQKINDFARGCFDGVEPISHIEAEYELLPEEVTMEQAVELYKLEPYGVSNPVPVFVMYDMVVSSITTVGQGKHTKLLLAKDSLVINAMCFRKSQDDIDVLVGDKVDVMFNLDINEFQNTKNLQYIVKDIRLNYEDYKKEESEIALYHRIKDGSFDFSKIGEKQIKEIVPERGDFADVYNLLKKELRLDNNKFSIRGIQSLLKQHGITMKYVKLKYIILVFQEMNILGVDKPEDKEDVYQFSYVYVKNKADLDKSSILRKLKAASMQKNG